MLRRAFLQTLPVAAAAMTAAAAEESPVKLGFDTYSLRAFKWKGTQLLDYAAGLKLDTIQFSALADYGPLEPQNLQKVKEQARRSSTYRSTAEWAASANPPRRSTRTARRRASSCSRA